jgi:hypothetical protein
VIKRNSIQGVANYFFYFDRRRTNLKEMEKGGFTPSDTLAYGTRGCRGWDSSFDRPAEGGSLNCWEKYDVSS